MALLTFPPSPLNGDLYPVSPLPGQSQYQWDSANQTWVLLGSGTGVAPGTYGDAYNVGQFTVDAVGRITFAQNVAIAANTPDLQQVTTQGAVTTDTIDVGGLISAGLTYPVTDGIGGDYLTTDGSGVLSWVTPPATPDLQVVTNAGATSTNAIDVAGLTAAGLIYPPVDGASGDYLTTNGAGVLSWVTPPATPDLDAVTTAGNTTANSIDIGGLTAAGLNYPLADGVSNQVISTDGAGNLGWLQTLKVVSAPTSQGDAGNPGEVAYDSGYFYWYDGASWQRSVADPIPW